MYVPREEYAQIAHQIATYPKKIERGHVFTANNYYLCTDIDKDGNFKVRYAIPIEGNEDLIDEIRKRDSKESVLPISPSRSTAGIIAALESKRGRTGWDDVVSEGQPGGYGRDASLHLGPQSESGGDRQEAGGNNETQAETAEPEEGYGLNGEASADAAELARIMLEGGILDGMTRGEVKKLLSLVA